MEQWASDTNIFLSNRGCCEEDSDFTPRTRDRRDARSVAHTRGVLIAVLLHATQTRACVGLMQATTPLQLGRWTVARLADGTVQSGVLYTVDPESGHVVLLQPAANGDRRSVEPLIVFASAIVNVMQEAGGACASDDATLERVDAHLVGDNGFDAASIERRHAALTGLLSSQRAPFEECPGGELLILGCLRIHPPYTSRSCRCENETVLDRFLEMLADNPLPT